MITSRIKEFIDFKGISMYAFENSIACSRGAIAKAVRENKSIGSMMLENILNRYPELDPTWLLTGSGTMIRTFGHVQVGKENSIENSPINISSGIELAQLKKENELLKERLKDKEEIIKLLKNNK